MIIKESISFQRGLDPKEALDVGVTKLLDDLLKDFHAIGGKYLEDILKKYHKADIYDFLKAAYDEYKNPNRPNKEMINIPRFMEEFKIGNKTFQETFYPGIDLDPKNKSYNEEWLEEKISMHRVGSYNHFYVNGGFFTIEYGLLCSTKESIKTLRKLVSREWMKKHTL